MKEQFDFKNASKEEFHKKCSEIGKGLGDDQFFVKKEFNYLQEILQDNEQILAFSSGFMDGNTWLISLTDRRIIFLDKGLIYGLKQDIIPLNRVNAISGKTGMMFGNIQVTDGARTRIIKNVWKKTVITFTNKVQETLDAINKSPVLRSSENTQQPATKENKYEELEKLAALKEKGLISEEEFNQEKKKLLDN